MSDLIKWEFGGNEYVFKKGQSPFEMDEVGKIAQAKLSPEEELLQKYALAIDHVRNRHALKIDHPEWAKEAVDAVGTDGFVEILRGGLKGMTYLKMAMWESKIDEFIYVRRAKHFGNDDLVDRIKAQKAEEQRLITAEMVSEKLKGDSEPDDNSLPFKNMGLFIPSGRHKDGTYIKLPPVT